MDKLLMLLITDDMCRTKIEWRSDSRENYLLFRKRHPSIELTYKEWRNIIHSFNELYRECVLESGDKVKFFYGFGEFAIVKKKKRKVVTDQLGNERINLPIDWQKTKEKGKVVYNFNFHTEGFFFGWKWFKPTKGFKHAQLWHFKASRASSRLLAKYIKGDEKYQHLYKEWNGI